MPPQGQRCDRGDAQCPSGGARPLRGDLGPIETDLRRKIGREPWEDGRFMLGSVHDAAPPLVGRVEEQGLLTLLLDDVGTRGQALVLRGEPGIGKSRLLAEAERTARERGMPVLKTTGVQSEAHLPFAGLHQLLRPGRGRAAVLPEVMRAALDAAFGLTREVAPQLSVEARARVLREAAGNPLALLELPSVGDRHEDEQWLPGGLPLTERLERAFAARASDLPEATRLVLVVAALNDGDAVDEILQAGSAIAAT